MRLQVVIPTYDNVAELKRCLGALAVQTASDFGVLVCVDGSRDGTADRIATLTLPFPVTVLEHPDRANHGRAAARNLALPHLAAPVTLLLDSDMRLDAGGVEKHLAMVEGRGCVSIGRVVYDNRATNLWARYQSTRGANKWPPGSTVRALDFMTANTALSTADLLAVGGFDEAITGYGGEDTELAIRLAKVTGKAFVFNGEAVARTTEEKTVPVALAQLDRFARTNLRAIRARHPGGPAPFWIDRVDSQRPRDRLLRLLLNPLSDRIADVLLPWVPFALQRRILDYKVIRTIFQGFREAAR